MPSTDAADAPDANTSANNAARSDLIVSLPVNRTAAIILTRVSSRTSSFVVLALAGGLVASAQEPASRSAPTYTIAQAAAGKAAYERSCASCHGGNLDDGPLAPALKGVAFMQKYGGKRVEDLLAKVATMPPASPNSLDGS